MLGVREHLSCVIAVSKWLTNIARHHWRIVEVIQETTAMFGEDNLLLGALDCCGEVKIICFLDFLASL